MLNKQQKLAREIADALNDMEAVSIYEGFAYKYTEDFLRRILQRVLSIPQDQIRKTRGALFTFLIKQNQRGSDRGHEED